MRCLVGVLGWVAMLGVVEAHAMRQVRAEITVEDGKWHGSVWLEAWALYPEDGPKVPAYDPDTPNTAGTDWVDKLDEYEHGLMRAIAAGFLEHTFLLKLNEQRLKAEYAFPDYRERPLPELKVNENENALLKVDLKGELPEGATGPITLVWNDDEYEPLLLDVKIPSAKYKELIKIEPEQAPEELMRIEKDGEVKATSKGTSLLTWIMHGFRHILPLGLDHICFILGLFLLQPKMRPLLWQSSAFTIAHSITLSLVVLGVFTAPARIVEPMIAISIVYVGIENLWVKELKPWRVALVFGLGLLHGMGFASVMQELELPEGQVIKPLVGFNLGVELGQLAVLALAFGVTFWFIKNEKFKNFSKIASALIAVIGLYWTYERIFA